MRPLRVLVALTYHRPDVSGLTIYAGRLVQQLVWRGHCVTRFTSRYQARLLPREPLPRIETVRVPICRKVSKGMIMPWLPVYAWLLPRKHGMVNVPMHELAAVLLALCTRLLGKPAFLPYQCDLQLPARWVHRIDDAALIPLNTGAAKFAAYVVASSQDDALCRPFLSRYFRKLRAIPPLIQVAAEDPHWTAQLQAHAMSSPCVGFAARFTEDKGVGYMLAAMPTIIEKAPESRAASTGAYKETIGEEACWQRLQPLLERHRRRLLFLALLPGQARPSFYRGCDIVVITPLNSSETFGMVQVKARSCGTPVVATNLLDVFEVVRRTGMGEIVPRRSSPALAEAIVRVLRNRAFYVQPQNDVELVFPPKSSARAYAGMFHLLRDSKRGGRCDPGL